MPSEIEVELPHKLLTLLTLPALLTLDTLLYGFISFGATKLRVYWLVRIPQKQA